MIAARNLVFVLALAAAFVSAFVSAWAPSARAQEQGAFLSVIEDIPLMPGLVEDQASAVVFDAAHGRLAETVAVGSSGRPGIAAFYAETLPALGWQADGETRWVREGEALTIEFEDVAAGAKSAGDIAVRFYLSPVKSR